VLFKQAGELVTGARLNAPNGSKIVRRLPRNSCSLPVGNVTSLAALRIEPWPGLARPRA
jgi:hypothetical protein